MSQQKLSSYAKSDILVSTQWVEDNLDKFAEDTENPEYRLVESNEDPLLYRSRHIPGAIQIDWAEDLNDPVKRDYIDAEQFQALMREKGISNDTTVVFYGDRSNWYSVYSLWTFTLYGHDIDKLKLMDGGTIKWEAEDRPTVKEVPEYPTTQYSAIERFDYRERAFLDDVTKHISEGKPLVDVRSPEEFKGERLHIPGLPNEGALRGGHIPGANSISWSMAANDDGSFKELDELREIYIEKFGLNPEQSVITYCRIGERAAHSWFVLKYLLGFDKVRNYDGSWTEYGNRIGVEICNPTVEGGIHADCNH